MLRREGDIHCVFEPKVCRNVILKTLSNQAPTGTHHQSPEQGFFELFEDDIYALQHYNERLHLRLITRQEITANDRVFLSHAP